MSQPDAHGRDVLVVDEDGTLVGMCTRHDLLRTRLALLAHERHEPGWLAWRVGRGPGCDGEAVVP
jgi:hypothetical protein